MRLRLRTFALLVALPACTTTVQGEPLDDADGGDARSSSSSGASSSGAQSSGSYENDGGTPATRPPPVVTNVTPLSGDYGTPITITGDNLDEASATLSLGTPAGAVSLPMPAAGTANDVITKWTKNEIVFKYPFPAEGEIRVTTRSGQADAKSFTPSWTPGTPLAGVFSRREMLAVVSPSAGRLVALFDGATGPVVVVAEPNGAVTSKPFTRGPDMLLQASLWVTPAGQVDGIFVREGTLFTITDAAGAATTASTGVAATKAAGFIDATSAYAWVASGGTITKLRAPTWASTGESVTDPTPATAPGPSMTMGTDHSLYVGWGVNDSGSFPLYDHTSHPVNRRLRPGQTTFDTQRTLGGGADDYMSFTRFRGGPGGRLASYYCANDTGLFSSTSWDCGEGYVADIAPPTITGTSQYVPGWNATTTVATYCEDATKTMKLGVEGNTASHVAALFPCPHVAAITVDPANDPVFVTWAGKYLYAPKKR